MGAADDIAASVARAAIEAIVNGTTKPQYIGSGRWVWSREALEVEIVAAVEDYRKRAAVYLLTCAQDCQDYSGSDLSYGQQQGYERASESLDEVPVRLEL